MLTTKANGDLAHIPMHADFDSAAATNGFVRVTSDGAKYDTWYQNSNYSNNLPNNLKTHYNHGVGSWTQPDLCVSYHQVGSPHCIKTKTLSMSGSDHKPIFTAYRLPRASSKELELKAAKK